MQNLTTSSLFAVIVLTAAVSLQASERYTPRPQGRTAQPAPVQPQHSVPPAYQPTRSQPQPGAPATTTPSPAPRVVRVVDSVKFDTGQNIFTGKLRLNEADPTLVAQQEPRLKELHAQLPKDVQESVKLPAMAGRMTNKQLADLEYFLLVRYNATLKPK